MTIICFIFKNLIYKVTALINIFFTKILFIFKICLLKKIRKIIYNKHFTLHVTILSRNLGKYYHSIQQINTVYSSLLMTSYILHVKFVVVLKKYSSKII